MPRPSLPKPEEVAGIARVLRAEGFDAIRIDTTPEGHVSISIGQPETVTNVTALQKWKAERGAS